MKIALYCPNKPLDHPNPSGDLIIARSLFRELTALGHECAEVVRFRSRWFWKSPGRILEASRCFVEALREVLRFRPDVWLTYHTYYKSPDVIGPWVSRLCSIPYVLFQPMYATKYRKRPETRTGFYLNRMALKAGRHAFVNNLDDLEALGRVMERNRITYLPPGIFPEEFERDEAAGRGIRAAHNIPDVMPLLMTACRFRADVKFESMVYLFKSLAILRARGREFMLLAVGDGPMETELRSMASDLLPGQVIFTGRIEREAMPAYYSAADLFAFPGIGESLGMVYLEAQACGLPVVALDTDGVPQVVQSGHTGLLAPSDDGLAMALAVADLLDNPGKRKEFGSNGMKFIFEERNLHRNYMNLASRLLKTA